MKLTTSAPEFQSEQKDKSGESFWDEKLVAV